MTPPATSPATAPVAPAGEVPQPRTAADRLGGRFAVSIPGFVVGSTIGYFGILVDVQRLGGRDGAAMLLGTTAVLLVNAVVDGVLHRTRWAHRRDRPVPVAEVLGRLMFSGACFAMVFALLRTVVGVPMPVGIIEGFVWYPAITMWIGSSVIIYLDVLDQARRLRRLAVQERSRSTDIVRRADATVADLRQRVEESLAPGLAAVRSVAADGSGSGNDVPETIRAVVDRSMRGVGHELWRRADGSAARVGPLEVLRGLVTRPTFRPVPIIGLSIALPVAGDPTLVRPWPLLVGAISVVVVYLQCRAANGLMARHPRWRPLVVATTIAVFVTQSEIVDRMGDSWGQPPDSPGVAVVVVMTIVLVAVTSAFGSYRDLDDARAQALAADIRADRFEAEAHALAVSEETRRLAALLHGRLQSRLLGCAMAIEFAGDDPVALRVALDRTVTVLDEGWHSPEGDDRSPLTAAVAPWTALAEVRIAGAEEIPDALAGDAAIVVEELVANAVRHGRAGRVDVTIDGTDDGCSITVVDDGTVDDPQHRPGLGSVVLERAGTVERSPGPNGWTVTVRLRGA